MIARIWRGETASSVADEYLAYLEATGLADYGSVEGNRGVFVLRRIVEEKAEFQLISLWDSYDAIRKFSGDDIEGARYYPEDEKYLLALDPEVTHYDVVFGGD